MVTFRPGRSRLYLKAHREAHEVSGAEMAELLGIARESVYRIERSERFSALWQAKYGQALKISPAAFWQPPGGTSAPTYTLASMPPGELAELIENIAAAVVRLLKRPKK